MKTYDILVIGSGIAGLTFAYKMAPYAKVGIITKKAPYDSNTNYAQGGIAGVFAEDDSFEDHIRDTMSTGRNLCHKDAVQVMVENGPRLVKELKDMGARFDCDENGNFKLGKEGGHSKRRIVYAGDYTGYEIEKTLLKTISVYSNVDMLDNHFACDLIVDDSDRCQGVFVLDRSRNEIEPYFSQFVLITTGGIGQIYKHSTNPVIATGDGIAMAYIANAKVANMEFVQFHPTTLFGPEENGRSFLISEAVRGDGGFLKLVNNRQFMHKYHELKSLAPRDIVARAIDAELKLSGEDFVYLDLSAYSLESFSRRFPRIFKKCRDSGINVPSEPIPVVPAAHYSCGGILTDINAATSIENLYAVGESSCTGVHGANRLASNSLLEAIVFAERAAEDMKQKMSGEFDTSVPGFYNQPVAVDDSIMSELSSIRGRLRDIMWQKVAIVRSMKSIEDADSKINDLFNQFLSFEKYNTLEYFELRNMIIVSKIIIKSAFTRKESRGLHFLQDHPETDDKNFLHDTIIQKEV